VKNTGVSKSASKPQSIFIRNLLVFIAIVFAQFQFLTYSKFPITFSLFALLPTLFIIFEGKIRSSILVLLLLVNINFLLTYFIYASTIETTEWFRSFTLFLFAGIAILLMARTPISNLKEYLPAIRLTIIVSSIFSIAQAIFGNKRIEWLEKPFGYFTNYFKLPGDYSERFPRAYGFYNEPSFNAIVALAVLPYVLTLETRHKNKLLFLVFVWLLSARSFSGLVSYIILFSLIFFSTKRKGFNVALIAVTFAIYANYLIYRLNSISEDGSSANYRTVGALRLFVSEFPSKPFGSPLGTREQLLFNYQIILNRQVGVSVDNGFLYFLLVSGILGIVILLLAIILVCRLCVLHFRLQDENWPIFLIPFFLIFATGSINMPEFLLMMAICIACLGKHHKNIVNAKELAKYENLIRQH